MTTQKKGRPRSEDAIAKTIEQAQQRKQQLELRRAQVSGELAELRDSYSRALATSDELTSVQDMPRRIRELTEEAEALERTVQLLGSSLAELDAEMLQSRIAATTAIAATRVH